MTNPRAHNVILSYRIAIILQLTSPIRKYSIFSDRIWESSGLYHVATANGLDLGFSVTSLSIRDKVGQMDNRKQASRVNFFILFRKSKILFHRAILSSVILKEQCHEDFAVSGQFCAKIITLRL